MTCSICQQKGHNKQTCSVVIKYTYDDCGVKCRINPNDEGDFQPVETYCLPCGSPTEECDCGEYKCGKWFNEEKGKFQGAPRRSSPRRPRPTTEIKMKLACADEGMEDCEYCGYTHHYEDKCPNEATAHHYEKWRVDEEDDDEVIACANCRVSGLKTDFREGSDDKLRCKDCDWSLGSDTEEEDDDKTVSVIGDLCECCGRPYDDRNPLRQSEMCDCVQNDDGTLSRPKEEDEESIPEVKDCGHFFDCGCGMTVCGECDDDMCDNEACAIYYTYRNDACMCDGCDFCEWKIRIRKSGLKLTPPFIPE